MEVAIKTRRLTKKFGRHLALSELDLDVPEGVVFGYLGPNGAGKTTTIRLLAGLIRPTAGSATVEEAAVPHMWWRVRQRSWSRRSRRTT